MLGGGDAVVDLARDAERRAAARDERRARGRAVAVGARPRGRRRERREVARDDGVLLVAPDRQHEAALELGDGGDRVADRRGDGAARPQPQRVVREVARERLAHREQKVHHLKLLGVVPGEERRERESERERESDTHTHSARAPLKSRAEKARRRARARSLSLEAYRAKRRRLGRNASIARAPATSSSRSRRS